MYIYTYTYIDNTYMYYWMLMVDEGMKNHNIVSFG